MLKWSKLCSKNRSQDITFGEVYDLARTYDRSADDTPRNGRKAISIYRRLARQGHPGAQYMLSLHYSLGENIHKSKRRARYWLTKAAEYGYADAQYGLAVDLLFDKKRNNKKAIFEWTEKAAMQGHVEALSYLAHCYQWGSGVERNDEMAVTIYRLLADNDIPDGLYNLGHCYQYGHGVEKDLTEAERLYRKAIELGNACAAIQLDDMLHPKETVDEDESNRNETAPANHPIGKRLIFCLLTTVMLSVVFSILSAVLFHYYAPFLKVYAGNRYTVFDGLFYKWPVVFVVIASMSAFSFLVTGSISRCKRKYGKEHVIMQNYHFKRMLPVILALMLFLIPTISRYCIGVSEYHLELGCIVGQAEFYHKLYFSCECLSLMSAIWLTSTQMSLDLGRNLLETICRIIYACFSLIASSGMIYLNCRIQPWLILPYVFMYVSMVIAIILTLRLMHNAALKAV